MSPTVRRIVADVCARHHVSERHLFGDSHARWISIPRQEAMALIYATGKLSLPQVGAAFNRHHTTVLAACRAYARRNRLQTGAIPGDESALSQSEALRAAVI